MKLIEELEALILAKGHQILRFSIEKNKFKILFYYNKEEYTEIETKRLIDIKSESEKTNLRFKTEIELFNSIVLEIDKHEMIIEEKENIRIKRNELEKQIKELEEEAKKEAARKWVLKLANVTFGFDGKIIHTIYLGKGNG